MRRPKKAKLYRYSGKRAESSRDARDIIPVRLDLGFAITVKQYLSIKDEVPFDEEIVFDIQKPVIKQNPVWRASVVTEKWSRACRYNCLVKKIYDGDTITEAVVDLGFRNQFTTKIRLDDINAPELRGNTKEAGRASRDRLRELILDKEVIIETDKDRKGKYGRHLATVYLDGVNINQQMMDEGFAIPY